MRRQDGRARWVAVGIGVTLVVAAASTMAYASIPAPDGVIHACITDGLGGGGLRAVESSDGCKDNEQPIDWNQQGPAGASGPAGSARAFAAIFPAGSEGGPSFHGASRGFASVTSGELVPGLSLYCLVPTADSGVSRLNSVMLVSVGNTNGGGFRQGAGVAVVGTCTDDGTPTGKVVGWHVVTWGEDGAVDDTVRFTVMVP